MESKHIMPKDIFVQENADGFALMRHSVNFYLGEFDFNILHKAHSGDNAKYTAEEICKRYNAHEELKNCLQAFVYQIETYNMKHEFPGAYMDAKNILKKVTDSSPVNIDT